MSKPGGKPIVKKRPFFQDKNIAIYTTKVDGKIVSFEFEETLKGATFRTGEPIVVRKEFKVVNHNILKAWQELQKHAEPITKNLLNAPRGSRGR